MSGGSILELRELEYRWPQEPRSLFGAMHLSVPAGHVVALLGANGTGKTTLLNVIAGRLEPTRGQVSVCQRAARPDDFNYMLQDPNRLLFPHLTIRQNIAICRHSCGSDPILQQSIKLLIRSDVADRLPTLCSGGERQRTVLCRAIGDVAHFPVTLLDEPFSQLSVDVRRTAYQLLRHAVTDAGHAAILVTHDILEAMIVGDMTVVLTDGSPTCFDTRYIQDKTAAAAAVTLRDNIQRSMLGIADTAKQAGSKQGAASI